MAILAHTEFESTLGYRSICFEQATKPNQIKTKQDKTILKVNKVK